MPGRDTARRHGVMALCAEPPPSLCAEPPRTYSRRALSHRFVAALRGAAVTELA
jgi:hypothetical protein